MELSALTNDAARAVNISDLFTLMSMALKSPSRELVDGVWDGSFFHDLNDCCESLGLEPVTICEMATDPEVLYHQINQEYTRLFLAPWNEQMIITEGAFLHGKKTAQFVNETALHAEQCYRHAMYLFEEKGSLPGDHIAIEFAFFAFLYANLGLALQANRSDLAKTSDVALREFSEKHLQRWVLAFMNTLSKETSNPFYQAIARVGQQLDAFLNI